MVTSSITVTSIARILIRSIVLHSTIILLLSCRWVVFPQTAHQTDSTQLSDSLKCSTNIFSNTLRLVSEPLNFGRDQWLIAGGVATGTVLMISIDDRVRHFAQHNQSSVGDALADVGNTYGNAIPLLMTSAGLYLGGMAYGNKDVEETGEMLTEAIVVAGVSGFIIKTIVGRDRPATGQGPRSFRTFEIHEEETSLPSGHSNLAFAVSTILANRFKNTYATVGLYALSTLTMMSRIYSDKHWLSDTFLGAGLGTAVGLMTIHVHETSGDGHTLRCIPSVGGIRIEMGF